MPAGGADWLDGARKGPLVVTGRVVSTRDFASVIVYKNQERDEGLIDYEAAVASIIHQLSVFTFRS
jgi:hypothetical protein